MLGQTWINIEMLYKVILTLAVLIEVFKKNVIIQVT